MAAGQHNPSRRALLGAVVSLPLASSFPRKGDPNCARGFSERDVSDMFRLPEARGREDSAEGRGASVTGGRAIELFGALRGKASAGDESRRERPSDRFA